LIILEDKKIRQNFIFINSLRIAVLSALLFIAIFLLLFEVPFPAVPIIISLLGAFIFSISNFYIFKRLNYRVAVYLQLSVDIILITILVYFSQAFRSPFYFLYILPIIVSSIFLTRRDTIYIASFSFIIFGVMSNLTYLEIIPFYPEIAEADIPLGHVIYNLTMSFIAFSVVALLSSFYFDKIRRTDAELKSVQENLRDMILLNNTVMEKMENGFVTSDSKGVIISYNEKAKSMLKLSSKTNIASLLADKTGSPTIEEIFQSTGKIRNYFEIIINDLTLGISVSVIENIYSFNRLFVFIITDLTDKRAIEETLKRKERLALIGEMAAGIAHEIRNPLASISGSVQFLQKELHPGNEEHKNLMDIIIKESGRLSQSIEEFLSFTTTTPLQKTGIDLSALVEEITDLVALNYKNVVLVKKYHPGYFIHADAKYMKQLLWNLVNNAVKAVNGQGTIEINIYRNEEDVYLSITDNGIGIEASELSKIFTPFYSRFSSGIGLGMALVKRIIDDHNFEIKINSQKNIGTEVTVCFRNQQKY
jgi:two-component system sensor histidine kinase PilS (NtrC family)